MKNKECKLKRVNTFEINGWKNIFGQSNQSEYIFNYLSDLNSKTLIIEENYIDKDYLIDYSKFYARSFDRLDKFTKRIHFFCEEISEDKFNKLLEQGNKKYLKILESSYLGFVIVKPIKDMHANYLIGRTLLRTYPSDVKSSSKSDHRFYIKNVHHVSLFGIPLIIESLPFQMQDTAVGACATNACWMIMDSLNNLFGVQKFSPFEVTEMSVSFPSFEERNFPNSTGLTLLQMKGYFSMIGLETEFIHIERIQKKFQNFDLTRDDIVADAVKAYSNLKLPLIAAYRLEKDNKGNIPGDKDDNSDHHAAVICGYRQNEDELKELYIHDDQIGPYSRALPDGKFNKINNEWKARGYKDIYIEKLMVPIYPKIRFSFYVIYSIFLDCKRSFESHGETRSPELFLSELNQYKEFLWKKTFQNKTNILCKSFPRYIWIIRTYSNGILDCDFVFDGTSVNLLPFCRILFEI